MELPQAPFWLTRLSPQGEESRPMKIGDALASKILFTQANSLKPFLTSTSPRMLNTQNGGLRYTVEVRICPGYSSGFSDSSVLYHIGPRRMPNSWRFHGISMPLWPKRVPIEVSYWYMRVAVSVPNAGGAP